ncbi:MAG: HepT-like ribonuclease domain-containing protein [Cyanobacteria bacterium J06621_3]
MTAQIASLPAVLRDRLKTPFSHIENFCQQWNIQEFALFGSVIRDDFTSTSDIDVLIEWKPAASHGLFDIVQMQEELTQLFNRPVDLTQKKQVKNPFSKAEILGSYRIIYPPENANFTGLIPADTLKTKVVRDNAALFDMVKAAEAIKSFLLNKTFTDYLSDEVLRSAVERNLGLLGRTANRLSASFQSQHPEISYDDIIDLEKTIIHQYDKPDHERDWNTATKDIPLLLKQIWLLVPDLPTADEFMSD